MPRRIIFEPEARLEFEAAVGHYNEQQPGLGERFETDVAAILRRVLETPERFRLVGKTVRIARLKVFTKYAVYYHVEPAFIGVVSIFHGSRDPAQIRRRLK